jgi:hypothetical protein
VGREGREKVTYGGLGIVGGLVGFIFLVEGGKRPGLMVGGCPRAGEEWVGEGEGGAGCSLRNSNPLREHALLGKI